MSHSDQDPNEPGKKHWHERCRDQMAKTQKFAKEFSGKSSGVVGKLYYTSLVVAGVAGLATLNNVPGAAAVMMGAIGVSKVTKLVWDHVRDLKDAAEDLEEDQNEDAIMERMDQTTTELEQLRALVQEQRDVINLQSEANHKMQESLIESDSRLTELAESHNNLAAVLKHFVGDENAEKVITEARETYRQKYQGELNEAIERGEIEYVPFDAESDDLVRISGESPNTAPADTEDEGERLTL